MHFHNNTIRNVWACPTVVDWNEKKKDYLSVSQFLSEKKISSATT